MTNVQPAKLGANMGMLHQQMSSVTHPAPRPIAQGKEGLPTHVIGFLHQIVEDKPLIWREYTRGKQLLCFDLDSTGGIAFECFFLVDKPLAEVFDHRFDPSAMAHTISLPFEQSEVSLDDRGGELFRLKVSAMSRSRCNPFGELTQDTCVDIDGMVVGLVKTEIDQI